MTKGCGQSGALHVPEMVPMMTSIEHSEYLREKRGAFGIRALLVRREDGATAIEFALVAPLFIYLLAAILEFALIFAAQLLLDHATQQAARTGRTGFVTTDASQDATVKEILNDMVGPLLDTDALVITSKSYSGFDAIGEEEPYVDANGNGERDNGENYTDVNGNGQWDEDQGTDGYGSSGEVVVYTVSYDWTVVTPYIGNIVGNSGVVTIAATAIVQNEPE